MKTLIIKIPTLILLLALWSCGENSANKNAQDTTPLETDNTVQVTKAQFDQSQMQLDSLTEQEFPQVIHVNGMIDVPPENRAVVSALKGGYIKTSPLLIGDVVKKGQVLVTLESPEFVAMQQSYLEIYEQLAYLKAEFERQEQMLAENIISKKIYLKAQSDYKTAVATYNGLQKQLRMLNINPKQVEQGNISSVVTIYAPISGSITKVNVTKGSYVSPATEILEIIDNEHIHLELSVFEKDIMQIKQGQEIYFKIPEASSGQFKATVYLVGTSIDENRTIKVHAHLDNEEDKFLTGMFVDADIVTSGTIALGIPSTAVVESGGKSMVMTLKQTTADAYIFEPITVNVIATYNGYSQLEKRDRITLNTKILTQGAFSLIGQ